MKIFKKICVFVALGAALVGSIVWAKSGSDAKSANSTGNANRDYVKAASSVESAMDSFSNSDFAGALNKARMAENLLNGILENYPESDIALKIVTDPNLRLGCCKYLEFKGKILPSFALSANEKMRPFDVAWTLSVSSGNEKLIEYFATYLAYANYQKKSLEKSSGFKFPVDFNRDEMLVEVSKYIKNPQSRLQVSQAISKADMLESSLAKVQRNFVVQKPANAQGLMTEKELKNFEKIANTSAYAMDASEKLLAIAKQFKISDEQKKIVKPLLDKTFENSSKISVPRMKNKAMSELAKTFVCFNMLDDALKCISELAEDKNLSKECLSEIALKNAELGDVNEALNICVLLKDSELESRILKMSSLKKLEEKKLDEAFALASKITNQASKNHATLMVLALSHLENKPYKISFEKGSNGFDASLFYESNSESLIEFCRNAGIAYNANYESEIERKISLLLAIFKSIRGVENSQKLDFFEKYVEPSYQDLKGKKGQANIVFDVISQAIIWGMDYKGVVEDLQRVLLDFSVDSVFYKLTDCGVLASLAGKPEMANVFFEKATQACLDVSDKNRESKLLYLAWQMQISGFEKSRLSQIMKPFLPNFRD